MWRAKASKKKSAASSPRKTPQTVQRPAYRGDVIQRLDRHRAAHRGQISRSDGYPSFFQAPTAVFAQIIFQEIARRYERDQSFGNFPPYQPTEALKQYAEQKVRRIGKYFSQPLDAHVILAVDAKERQVAEVELHTHGTMILGKENIKIFMQRSIWRSTRSSGRSRNKRQKPSSSEEGPTREDHRFS